MATLRSAFEARSAWRGVLSARTGEDELEAGRGPVVVVDEVAAVGACVGAGDREAEAASLGVGAALEAVEEAGLKLLGDAFAAIGDRDAKVAVALFGGKLDRWSTVADRVDEQVGDDPVERDGVEESREVRGNVERYGRVRRQ
jgi:hypothetical protein